jgi:hypothetical protein
MDISKVGVPLYVAALLTDMAVSAPPLHIVWVLLDIDAFGAGSTFTVVVTGVPFEQPESVGVIVNVTVSHVSLLLVRVPVIVPGNDTPVRAV